MRYFDGLTGEEWEMFLSKLSFCRGKIGNRSLLPRERDTEKAARSEAGVSYKTEVKCNVTMDNPSMLSGFSTLEHADVVIRVMYNSGEWKVIGIPGNPVKTSAELEVAKSGLFKVSFQCDSIYRARFLKA